MIDELLGIVLCLCILVLYSLMSSWMSADRPVGAAAFIQKVSGIQ